jgi:hypothetical protein
MELALVVCLFQIGKIALRTECFILGVIGIDEDIDPDEQDTTTGMSQWICTVLHC